MKGLPISKRWSAFTKTNVNRESNNFGVYELGNASGLVHYIGEGKVRDRLLAHFAVGSDPIPGTGYYRVEYTGGKTRAVQRQNALLSAYKQVHGQLPRFNQRRRG